MSLSIYINFKDQSKEAMEYYQKVLNAKILEISYYKEMPDDPEFPITKEIEDLVMNGQIEVFGGIIMFTDMPDVLAMEPKVGDNLSIVINTKDYQQGKDAFDNLSKDGKIVMPFEKTFWAAGYGIVIDKFQITWQINIDTSSVN